MCVCVCVCVWGGGGGGGGIGSINYYHLNTQVKRQKYDLFHKSALHMVRYFKSRSVSKLIYFNFILQYMHGHDCSNALMLPTIVRLSMHHNLDISGNYTHNTTEIT